MDFDLDSTVSDMANNNSQPGVSMQQLLNNPSQAATSSQPMHMQWTTSQQQAPQDLPNMHHLSHDPHAQQYARLPLASAHSFPPQPMHPTDRRPPLPIDIKPVHKPSTTYELDDSPPIEPHIVMQMGGIPYADLCKEKAREAFKEMKKNEHMAKGEFDRMKRRKKGDTSMTPREKYTRRLKMNQDSAAAARYAQEVYVHMLEKLVRTTEEEKKGFILQVQQLQQENSKLKDKMMQMQSSQPPVDALFEESERDRRVYDPAQINKLLDMMYERETPSAQDNDANFAAGNMGIPPARAA